VSDQRPNPTMASHDLPRHRQVSLVYLGLPLLCLGLCGFWYWQRVLLPPELTRLHASELAPVIGRFEAMLFSLEVQLQPDLILSVATQEYYERHLSFHPSLNCPGCGQFEITTGADATQVCVLSYSQARAVARASVTLTTVQVDSVTYQPVGPTSSSIYRSTYHLVRQGEQWKVDIVTDWTPANKGQADVFEVAREYWDEVGCR
jgi:hypothetical protein